MIEESSNASYRVALPEFEGPLDLLLHLCKTNEIDIVNIPIAFITEKYLEYLDVMTSLSVDVAADYLVMAATLAYLKSRELVPTPDPIEIDSESGEEVVDPREELIRRLLEYRKYKDAAQQLGGRPIEGKNVFGRGMPLSQKSDDAANPLPFAEHSVWKLIEAFGKLLEKAGPRVVHEVIFDRVSISARINQIIDRLEQGGGAFRFDALFAAGTPEPELRSQLVVSLLAILELARLKVVRVLASDDQETLFIAHVAGTELADARKAYITSSDESGTEALAEPSEDAPPEASAEALDAPGETSHEPLAMDDDSLDDDEFGLESLGELPEPPLAEPEEPARAESEEPSRTEQPALSLAESAEPSLAESPAPTRAEPPEEPRAESQGESQEESHEET